MADPVRYTVSLTYTARLQFALLQRRAVIFGVAERVLACLRDIDRELQTNPREWGEPSSTLHEMRMILHTGFRDRIRVDYGVHETQPMVVIRNIEPEAGHPLHRQKG
jgi:hypothetical protein